jgi:transcriptional regulator with XRE-family HTH domain
MPIEVRFTLGDVVRKLREQQHLTLRQLAAKADVNFTAIGRLENEPHRSEQRTIERVAAALGTTTLELFAAANVVRLNSEQQELLDVFATLDARRRQILLTVARREHEAWSRADRERDRVVKPDRPGKASGTK